MALPGLALRTGVAAMLVLLVVQQAATQSGDSSDSPLAELIEPTPSSTSAIPAAPVVASPTPQATPTPGLATPSATTGAPRVHLVQPGDTLASIARRYEATGDQLLRLNTLPNPDLIRPGQIITLPPVAP